MKASSAKGDSQNPSSDNCAFNYLREVLSIDLIAVHAPLGSRIPPALRAERLGKIPEMRQVHVHARGGDGGDIDIDI